MLDFISFFFVSSVAENIAPKWKVTLDVVKAAAASPSQQQENEENVCQEYRCSTDDDRTSKVVTKNN